MTDLNMLFAEKWEAIDDLVDMVMDRDMDDAVRLATMIHELTKMYVAGVFPTPTVVENIAGEVLSLEFIHRNAVTANQLFKHLGVFDDDGIPM